MSVMSFGGKRKDRDEKNDGRKPASIAGGAAAPSDESARGGGKSVIMYATKWCGVCKRAKRYFAEKNIALVEKDIEKDPGAREEMTAKAKAQGVAAGGVPVFDIGGKIVKGFSEARIAQLLK